jgi:hypothetical protein
MYVREGTAGCGGLRMRRVGIIAVGVVLPLSLPAFSPAASHGPSKQQVDRAAAELGTAIKSYLSTNNISGPPSDPSTWSAFFDAADRRVADLRHKFEIWVSLSNKRIAAGHLPQQGVRTVRTYQQALAVWVADQEEGGTLSRECFEQSGSVVDAASARACLSQLFATNGARWQADGDRLVRAARRARR